MKKRSERVSGDPVAEDTKTWACIAFLLLLGSPAEGPNVVNNFTGGTVNFNAASSWNPGIPGAEDHVTISGLTSTATLQMNTSALSLRSLTYGASAGNLALIGYNADRVLSVAGALAVDGGSGRAMTFRNGNFGLNVNAGSVAVNSGTLQMGTQSQVLAGFTAGNTVVALNSLLQVRQITTSADFGSTELSGTVQLNATTNQNVHNQITVGALTGSGSIKVRDSGPNANQVTLTLGGSAGTATFSGTITDTDVDADRLNLVKAGAGTQVLTGTNSYRGTTTVSSGMLVIRGDQSSATGKVTVRSGAALGGDGTIGGNLTLEDGAKFFFHPSRTLTVQGDVVDLGNLSVAKLTRLDSTAADGLYTLVDGEAVIDFKRVQNIGEKNAKSIGFEKYAYFTEETNSLKFMVFSAPCSLTASADPDYPLPLAFSVPFAEGAVTNISQISIKQGSSVLPQQWRALGFWPDNSIKWAQAVCPPAENYEVDLSGTRPVVSDAVQVWQSLSEPSAVITSGNISLQITNSTAILRSGTRELAFGLSQVTTTNGDVLPGRIESLDVLESGPMRAVVRAMGLHRSAAHPDGFIQFDVSLTLYAGSATVEVDHTLVVISGNQAENLDNEMLFFKSARIPVQLPSNDAPVSFSAYEASANDFELAAGERLFQWEDFAWVVEGPGGVTQQGQRADGVLVAAAQSGSCFAGVRDFWQQYPKGYTARTNGFDIDLFPELSLEGSNPYANRENEHVWYYYLRSGNYELKQGVSKSHRLFIGLQDTPAEASEVAGALQNIPVVMPSRSYTQATRVMGPMLEPFSGGLFSDWDQAFLNGIASYFTQQQQQRWYGLLNWGDWFGERSYNWCNHEYDLPETMFRQALRFEDPDLMREAFRQNAHRRDVDVVHAHVDPAKEGVNWKHSVGHTGGYYDTNNPPFSLANYGQSDAVFFTGSSSPGHTRTASFFTDYFLTGNPRSFETGCIAADKLLTYDLLIKTNFNYMTAREPGWSLICLTDAYRATGNTNYLGAANRLADRVIQKANGSGVWLRLLEPHQVAPGETLYGELSFPTAFQAAGMIALYELSGRSDVRENILQTAIYIRENLYRPAYRAFVHSPSTNRTQSARAGGIHGMNLRYILAYAYNLEPGEELLEPVLYSFASTAANRQWNGVKVNPDRPYPQDFSGSFYFLNEDQSAMDKAVGDLLRSQREQVLELAAPASTFPPPTQPWENVY